MEFLKSGIKTRAYEAHIRAIRESLEKHGAKTTAFTSYAPCPAMCLWTKGQRKRLHKRASGCEAALVMGCESARHTVEETLKGTTCRVILGMQLTGITNAALRLQFPLNVSLDNPAKVDTNEAVNHSHPKAPSVP